MAKTSKSVSKLANKYAKTWSNAVSITGINTNWTNYGTNTPTTTWSNITTSPLTTTTYPAITSPNITTGGNWINIPYNPNQYGGQSTYTVPSTYSNWSTVPPLLPDILNALLTEFAISTPINNSPEVDWSGLIGQMTEEVQGYYCFKKLITAKQQPDIDNLWNYMQSSNGLTGLNDTETILLECLIANIAIKGLNGNKTRIRALIDPHTSVEEALYLLLQHISPIVRLVGTKRNDAGTPDMVDYYKVLVPFVVKPLSVIYSDL